MLLFLAFACTETTETPSDPAVGPAPTTAPSPQPAPPPAPADPIATGSGKDHSNHWFVILSSKKELGHVPEGATKLMSKDAPVESELVRLSSTEFKKLQPCFEIVVAKTFEKRKEAVKYSKALTAAGIDNYPKRAGKWVGEQPRVEAYCEGERADSENTCPNDAVLAETHDGVHLLRVPLDAVVAERAMEGAAEPTRHTDTVWMSPLKAEKLGGFAVGDRYQGFDLSGPPGDCTITRFVAATRGTPHFGWYEMDDQDAPGCGEPIVMAQAECTGVDAVRFATKGMLARVQPGGETGPDDADAKAALAALQKDSRWTFFADEAGRRAAGRDVSVSYEYERWILDGTAGSGEQVLFSVVGNWITGEGYDECGGEDVNVLGWALVDPETQKVVGAPTNAYATTERLPVDFGADGAWEMWSMDWVGSQTISTGDSTVCANDFAYCDCGC